MSEDSPDAAADLRRPLPIDRRLSEAEHQSLDLLAELPRAAETGLDAHAEGPEAVEAALDVARPALERLSAEVGLSLVEAAAKLATTAEAGPLDLNQVSVAKAELERAPSLATTLPAARETVLLCLGIEPDSRAAAVLDERAEAAASSGPSPAWTQFAEALDDRIRAAWPEPGSAPTPIPLRMFRSATVVDAGPSVRARALAADDPVQIGLAEALVGQLADPEQLVARFEQARAASEAPPASDEPVMDGPKRKFTPGHLVLALLILGLTLWHYLWR